MSSLSFTKLFSSITDSSIWQESSDSRVVWVTLLAMADPLGRIQASVSGLARRSNVSREATESALAVFLAPDPDSRTTDHEGRRIDVIAGGWQLLNYKMYREMKDDEARKEKNRIYQERHRSKSDSKGCQEMSDKSLTVSINKKMSAQGEEEVEGEEDKAITPAMVSRAVLSELVLTGRDLAVVMDQICALEMAKGRNASDLRDALILSWQDYGQAKPQLSYTKGPTKFFGDGDWKSKTGWPWKDGRQPASGRIYVNS